MNKKEKEIIKWHHLFGITLTDYFTHSNFEVELEKEVSLKKQYIDIVILRKTEGIALKETVAGLEELNDYNIITYKSYAETLDAWTLEELIGYYSNYRKIISPDLNHLLPTSEFKLYAICTRYPTKLLNNNMLFTKVQPGIIDLTWGNRIIRIIVLKNITKEAQNALWQLFSSQEEGFVFGNDNYQWHCPEEQAILNQLYALYKVKGGKMPYNMTEFTKEFTKEHLHLLEPSDRLQGMAAKDRLQGMAASDRLQGMAASDVVTQFSAHDVVTQFSASEVVTQFSAQDRLQGMTSHDRLQGMSAKDIKAYLASIEKGTK